LTYSSEGTPAAGNRFECNFPKYAGQAVEQTVGRLAPEERSSLPDPVQCEWVRLCPLPLTGTAPNRVTQNSRAQRGTVKPKLNWGHLRAGIRLQLTRPHKPIPSAGKGGYVYPHSSFYTSVTKSKKGI